MRTLLAAAILTWVSTTAMTQQRDLNSFWSRDLNSGTFWYSPCKAFLTGQGDLPDTFRKGECGGIVETVAYLASFLPLDVRSCPPTGSTTGQAVRIVVSFLEAHPERLHEDFTDLAMEALRQAWPCVKGDRGK